MSFFRGLTTGKWLMRFLRSAVNRYRISKKPKNINHFTTFGRSAWRSSCQKIENPKEKLSQTIKTKENQQSDFGKRTHSPLYYMVGRSAWRSACQKIENLRKSLVRRRQTIKTKEYLEKIRGNKKTNCSVTGHFPFGKCCHLIKKCLSEGWYRIPPVRG